MTSQAECSIDDCGNPIQSRGWCQKHYGRWFRHGDPNYKRTPESRFMALVVKTDGCWEWVGHRRKSGYGSFYNGTRHQLVHRFSYEMHVGPIPEGMQIDHICHVRWCVNPIHLRATTPKQNCENLSGPTSRSTSGVRGVYWAHHARKWFVRVGHNGEVHHGGYFTNKDDAEAAAIALRNKLFTHNTTDRGPLK